MKLSELVRALGYEVLVEGAEGDVSAGYTSDLLSDVMANCPDEAVWITIQRHMNVIAVAQLKRISAIVMVNQTERMHLFWGGPGTKASTFSRLGTTLFRLPARFTRCWKKEALDGTG